MSCNKCRHCTVALNSRKSWGCKRMPWRKFNIRLLHGWLCRFKRIDWD